MANQLFIILSLAAMALNPVAVVGNMPPIFIKDMNLEVIKEDTPVGTSIYQLEGKDPEGGQVSYSLKGTEKLVVDPISGVVTVAKPLDHETTQTLRFHVILEDNVGNGQENNKVENPVSVVIVDVNDCSPLFQEDFFDIFVAEDTAIDTPVIQWINMTDLDLIGENLTLTCKIIAQFPDACTVFQIIPVQTSNAKYLGSLILKNQLDYDKRQFYQLLLIGSDGEHNTTAVVTVRIQDVQNKPPVFINGLIGNVTEGIPTGSNVMQIEAKDGDKTNPRNLTYDLITNPGNFFSINSQNGEIQIANLIDRESIATSVITLQVRVREIHNGIPLDDDLASSVSNVFVFIRDINDEPPKFNHNEVEVDCIENSLDGTVLNNITLFVTDPDISAKSELSISLLDDSGYFMVYPNHAPTGSALLQIKTQHGPLDYENPNHRKFILLVVAKETSTKEKLSSTATVTVNVKDVNDNSPQFDKSKYTVSVTESAPSGTSIAKIIAVDKDSGNYGTPSIRYSLMGEGAEKFALNPLTGLLSTAEIPSNKSDSWLDYETQNSYYLTYQARDENNMGLLSVTSLKINIADAEDNPPVFVQKNYTGTINEGDVEFNPHLTLEAKDKDERSVLRYEIVDGNVNQLFTIDSFTGELRATNTSGLYLGTVKTNRFNLTVKVTDGGKNTDSAPVTVSVQAINNNIPLFGHKIYNSVVMETALPGTFVNHVSATDLDSRDGEVVTYRISRGARDNFVVNETTGIISVSPSATFDYDKHPQYNIEVIAIDQGHPPRTATAILVVSINNTNDQPPRFTPKIQRAQVFEDAKPGTVIYTLNATDPDASSQEALKFTISNQTKIINRMGRELSLDMSKNYDFFSIDENTGDVRVVKELLREKQAEVSLKVMVTDSSANSLQTGTGTLIISIIDVNDAAPSFPAPWSPENPVITINVLEEQPVGAIVYTFVAIDEDSNLVNYALIPEDEHFEIDAISGVVTTKSAIDYETTQQIEFVVAAFDSGVPQLSAMALVTAVITNVNDNDPVFNQSEYLSTIQEHSPAGTYVTTVLAEDKDLGEFGNVHYTIAGDQSGDFAIDEKGVVRVLSDKILDRENASSITIHVVAKDDASDEMVKRSVSVPVTIKLLDINDNSPQFTEQEYRTSVMDSILVFPPTPILQLSASDADDGDNALIRYSISERNDDGLFYLNPQSGIFFPSKSLVGRAKNYHLEVEARDMNGTGSNFDRANVIIEVQEVNGNAPRIISPSYKNSTVHIFENEIPSDKILWTIQAEDPDQGSNGKVHYFIKDDDRNVVETKHFSINPDTGQLKLNEPLDREQKPKYMLVIVAIDEGVPQPLETLQQMVVVVKDKNDNEPQFPKTMFTNPYTFTIEENLQVGALVGKLEAIDRDSWENAVIYYFLVDASDEDVFAVDKQTGSIYTNQSLDFEHKRQYELVVKATNDASYVPHQRNQSDLSDETLNTNDSTLASVRIHVVDINDNVPTFPKSYYLAAISTNAKIGNLVTCVTASDPDEQDNGTLTYSLEKTTLFSLGTRETARVLEVPPFSISKDGAVVTTAAMNIYNQDHFKFIIGCKESKPPGRSTTTTLDAFVYDNEQLIRVVISKPMEDISSVINVINRDLSNASGGVAIITEIRRHVPRQDIGGMEWTDVIILVIDPEKRVVKPINDVLANMALKADSLYAKADIFRIVDIEPLKLHYRNAGFDPVLGALIALCIVLFLGTVIVIVVAHCLTKWYKDKIVSIVPKKREILEPPTTTENPLWIDQDNPLWSDPVSKNYEEQELSMAVATDLELQNRKKEAQPEAMYATVRRNAKSIRDNISAMEASDGYATLNQQGELGHPLSQNGTMRSNRLEYHEMYPKPTSPLDYQRTEAEDATHAYLPPPPPPTVSEIHPGAQYPQQMPMTNNFSQFATTEIL